LTTLYTAIQPPLLKTKDNKNNHFYGAHALGIFSSDFSLFFFPRDK
jgi:hypothetical protein